MNLLRLIESLPLDPGMTEMLKGLAMTTLGSVVETEWQIVIDKKSGGICLMIDGTVYSLTFKEVEGLINEGAIPQSFQRVASPGAAVGDLPAVGCPGPASPVAN